MRKLFLSSVLMIAALQFMLAQTPALGTYPATTIIAAGSNTTVIPSAVPANAVSITATTSPNFKGVLHANPVTGVLTITNAHPAGMYSITIKASNGISTATTTCLLTVNNPLCSQANFTGSDFFASGTPLSIAVGDFNNDGKQDFAAANSTTVRVWLGNGLGGFTTGSVVSIGSYPTSIGIGDFNGDGKQDFAVAIPDSNRIAILLGNGLGGFNTSANVSVVGGGSLAIGDFNTDGKQDMAINNFPDSSISIHLGDGAGGFTMGTSVSVGGSPGLLSIGDFNNDGKPDLSVAIAGSKVSILLGDGSGGFSGPTHVSIIGLQPIVIGDFNSDSKQDFITIVRAGIGLQIYVYFGDGAGGFSGTPIVGGGYALFNPSSWMAGDFNGDGKQDIAIAGVRGANGAVIIGTGDGTGHFFFTAPVVSASANEARSLVIGDFNGDGRQDFVVGNNGQISIRLNALNDINVKGNNTNIADGDTTADTTDYTDFTSVAIGSNLARSFSIQNTGAANLTVNSISLTGTDSLLFTISGISFPATIAAGATTNFTLRFTPTRVGVKTARVNISNNDCDESIYDFSVMGVAFCPAVSANNNVWLGTTTDWNLASNWSLGMVPTACTRVVVNVGVPFMPEVTAENSACYSLTVNNGATITVKTGAHLNIIANN